ncbi:DUF5623 domain-containing protein [Pseudobdellovibrio sp. HCB154]|uniref:DUF5623 domain-containing protein n=1 Tax=Pseudobdellovibrio sp. HCB154 TaxID=3386277 RepID=UPI003916E0C0
MSSSNDGHSVAYVKRNAKKIKKEKNISHHEALDLAAIEAGASNWKHFLRVNVESTKPTITAVVNKLPDPLTITFYLLGKCVRPNAKMPIEAHKQVGTLLGEVLAFTHLRKSVHKLVGSVCSELDDWVQNEYKTKQDMSDEDFRDMYYPHKADIQLKKSITDADANLLVEKLESVKNILLKFYHDCVPRETILVKLDQAALGLYKWAGVPQVTKELKRGTVIHVKPFGFDAVVLEENLMNQTVKFYSDSGHGMCARHEIKVYRQQPRSAEQPMRRVLPYGLWTCEDGSQVLYNRDYKPIWVKLTNGTVTALETNTWVTYKENEYFFNDSNPPWINKKTLAKCQGILQNWGVFEKIPAALTDYYEMVRTGIEPKKPSVKFPTP